MLSGGVGEWQEPLGAHGACSSRDGLHEALLAQEELGSLQLDSPHFDHAWDTRAEVDSEAASSPRTQICPRYRPESAVAGTTHPWALPPSHSPALFYSCLSLSHLLHYPGPTIAAGAGGAGAQLGTAGGRGGRQNAAQAASLPLSAQHRFVTVGPPPVSMETRESTTAQHWHFGSIDGKFYQLQLLRRQKGQESPGGALLRASLPAKGRGVPTA